MNQNDGDVLRVGALGPPPGRYVSTTAIGTAAVGAPRARRQLRRVLLLLGALDLSVLLLVIGLAISASRFGWTGLQLLLSILAGVGAILGIRIWLAVRLRRRSGDLF